MNIIWYGHSCFKIQSKDLVLITDPFDKSVGLKPPFCRADIVTVSHQHYDHNNTAVIKDNPFIIDGPGEYEIKGCLSEEFLRFTTIAKEPKEGPILFSLLKWRGLEFAIWEIWGRIV